MKAGRFFTLFLSLALVLSACNLPNAQATPTIDPQAVFTQAAETVVAQLTKSAVEQPPTQPPATLVPPTVAPAATATVAPQPAQATVTPAPAAPVAQCDSALFVTDVTVPDGTPYGGGATFIKTWRLKNTGTCTWNSTYSLVFDSGDQLGGAVSIPLAGTVAPGQTVDLSANLQAPASNGSYSGFWGLKNGSGARVPVAGGFGGKSFSVVIKVGNGGSAGATADPNTKFAVTSVGFSVDKSNKADCAANKFTITATITANKAGDVTYVWEPSKSALGTMSSTTGTVNFTDAGTTTIKFEWTNGGSGESVQLYIDKPNHQRFGPATLNCP
jgi:hypothetical protein